MQNQHHKARQQETSAQNGSQKQRRGGKGQDAFQGIPKQSPKGPFGLPGRPFHIFIFQIFGPEAHPVENPLGKAVALGQFQNGVHHLPGHKPEILGALHHFHLGKGVVYLIEHPGEEGAQGLFPFAADPPGGGAVVLPGNHRLIHLGQEGGRVLQIRVHNRHIISGGVLKARVYAGFLSEVPGKGKIAHPRVCLAQFL